MNANNTLFNAFKQHAGLTLKLKHDGSGMPTKIPGALLLAMTYIALNLINNHHAEGIPLATFLMVGFIAQCYVLFLRNKLVGLILFISILCNCFTLLLTFFAGIPAENLGLLIVSEYILVTAAIINVIKSETTHV